MTDVLKPISQDGAPVVSSSDGSTVLTVRELLTELAALEDAGRTAGGTRRQRQVALAREQEIIAELHRRCPVAPATG